MAQVGIDKLKDVPQIFNPVGSLAEVKALGIPTRNIATCSERDEKKNYGCLKHGQCDRVFKDTRPHMEVIQITSAAGVRVTVCPCFDAIDKEANAINKTQDVRVIAGEGDTYHYRGSKKLHPKRDPDCNFCSQGKCELYVDDDAIEAVCPVFPPAAKHPELVKFERMMLAKRSVTAKQKASISAALLGGADDPEDEDEVDENPLLTENTAPPAPRGSRARG